MVRFPGVLEVSLLVALGVGYAVLFLAKREEGKLQFAGNVIGGVIIGLAIIYLIGNLWLNSTCNMANVRYHKGMMYKGAMHKGMMAPR